MAGLARPFSGKIADTVGRKAVVFFGIFATVICSASYPIFAYILPFFIIRFFHGLAVGFAPTGNSALIADIATESRRGEAMGVMGLISNTGTSIAPVLGSFLTKSYGIETMFFSSALLALCSLATVFFVHETLQNKVRFHRQLLIIRRHEILEENVLPAALVMALCIFTYGAFLTVIPDFSKHLGIENKGIFFTIYTLSSVFTRIAAGKFSDKYGRVIVLKYALSVALLSLLTFMYASNATHFYAASVVYGAAVGMYSPALFAWAADLSHREHLGRGMSTIYIALEVGIAAGAFFGGMIYGNVIENLYWVFFSSFILNVFALIYLHFFCKKEQIMYKKD
jgi:MFS family permease